MNSRFPLDRLGALSLVEGQIPDSEEVFFPLFPGTGYRVSLDSPGTLSLVEGLDT